MKTAANGQLKRKSARRRRTENQNMNLQVELDELSARLHSVHEYESQRLGCEIHNELGTLLTCLRWDLVDITANVSRVDVPMHLAALQQKISRLALLTDKIIDTTRRIALELHPIMLDDLGLGEALQWYAQQFQARTGIAIQCVCQLEAQVLNHTQSTTLFRIAQGALINILRHAQATRVVLELQQADGTVCLLIQDNGRGITADEQAAATSLGLLGMRERARLIGGTLQITGVQTQGTMLTVRVPLRRKSANTDSN